MRIIVSLVFLSLVVIPTLAMTQETTTSPNFWQEFDIVFWQTVPFATIWGHFLDSQLSTSLSVVGAPHWNSIIGFTLLTSAANAFWHARSAVEIERTGYNN